MSAPDGAAPPLEVEEGFGLYLDLMADMARLRGAGPRNPFADEAFRDGPPGYVDIRWRPKSEERQHFGERVEPAEELSVPRCAVETDAVVLAIRHAAGAVGKRIAVIVNGRGTTLVRPAPLDGGEATRDVGLTLPFEGDVDGLVHVEILLEQRLVFSRAYRALDGVAVESAQPTPQIVEFRRFDGKALHFGIKRVDGAEPELSLPLRFSLDGAERWGAAELDPASAASAAVQKVYRLPVAGLLTDARAHEVVILGEGPADRIRKGVFSVIAAGGENFWMSRPARTPEGAGVTIVRDDAGRGEVVAVLSDGQGREAVGRPCADPAEFRFRKGDNSFSFTLDAPLAAYRTLHVRDKSGAPLFEVALEAGS